jgi:hypothetical protein
MYYMKQGKTGMPSELMAVPAAAKLLAVSPRTLYVDRGRRLSSGVSFCAIYVVPCEVGYTP